MKKTNKKGKNEEKTISWRPSKETISHYSDSLSLSPALVKECYSSSSSNFESSKKRKLHSSTRCSFILANAYLLRMLSIRCCRRRRCLVAGFEDFRLTGRQVEMREAENPSMFAGAGASWPEFKAPRWVVVKLGSCCCCVSARLGGGGNGGRRGSGQ